MTSRLRSAYILIVAALSAISGAWNAPSMRAAAQTSAPAAERSVWDGVYSEAQSQRGEKVYTDSCASCHGPDLAGSQIVPALVGDEFLMKWNGAVAGDLFELMRTTMPQDSPESLKPPQYADVLAFVFSKNRMPTGNTELAADFDALKTIRIEPSKKQ
jgi:mono/diheme cytochrome c family protein